MRISCLPIFFLLGFVHLQGQTAYSIADSTSASIEPIIYTFVDHNPEFPGGDAALVQFLQHNIKYPKKAKKKHIEGKVILRMVMDENGAITEVRVSKSADPDLDKEAVRVARMLPNFSPGLIKGKPVKVYYNLPIIFRLQ